MRGLNVVIIFVTIVVIWRIMTMDNDRAMESKKEYSAGKKVKSILYYTPFFDMKDFGFGYGEMPFIKNECPVSNCFTTSDKRYFSKYHVPTYLICLQIT